MNSVQFLGLVSSLSAAAPLVAGVYNFPRLRPELRILVVLFAVVVFVDCYSGYLAVKDRNMHWLHYLYTPVEYSLMVYVFSCWQDNIVLRRALRASIPVFIVICLWNMLISGQLSTLNNFTQSLATIVYVPLAAYTLLMLLRRDLGMIYRDYRFWMASALLFYSAGSLAYFALHNVLAAHPIFAVWYFHIGLNIVANFMYAAGFICHHR